MSTWRRRIRRVAKAGIGLGVAVAVLHLILVVLVWHWAAKPPVLVDSPAILARTNEMRGGRLCLGRNWLERRDGLPVLYLTGTPFEMGYANGKLTQAMIHRQEATMLELLRQVAPSRYVQFLLKCFVTYKNRHLADHIPAAYRMEMYGMVRGCPDPHPEVGPAFHRVLNYHAAQDISYLMMNSPWLRGGCTGFAAWGTQTRDGHLLVGRNFDWEAASVFDEDRLMVVCEPSEGLAFVSLAWAGMVGCVSAMNREGLGVFVNAAPSALPGRAATPTCIVVRDTVQHARTIAEATEIIRGHPVFVSALFLVASRADQRAVVIEKTPDQTRVREADGASWVVSANHYETTSLTNTAVNQQYLRAFSSRSRHERLVELVVGATGTMDVGGVVEILRDRKLPGGRFAGNGHRGALNGLLATHSVAMDLSAGLFWAASPPHQVGRFIPFDGVDFERRFPERVVGEDAIVATGEYGRYGKAQARLKEGWAALKRGQATVALACAQGAEGDNPGFYENAWLRAESLEALGRRGEARAACEAALGGDPALGHERRRLEQLRERLAATP